MGREIDLSNISFTSKETARLKSTGEAALSAVKAFVEAAKPFGKKLATIGDTEDEANRKGSSVDSIKFHSSVTGAEESYEQAGEIADKIARLLDDQFSIGNI